MNISQLYDKDFYQWTVETAKAIKNKAIDKIDFQHLQQEIEDMGISQLRELESRLDVLLMHLLKWQYQSNKQSRSWTLTIEEQRARIKDHIKENPSLKSKIDNSLLKSYRYAVIQAAKETKLDKATFPDSLPYTIEQILDDKFFPMSN